MRMSFVGHLAIFMSCLMISVIIAILSIEYPVEYNVLPGIVTLTGALTAL